MKQVVMGLSARLPSREKASGDSKPKSASLHLPRSHNPHHSDFEVHDDLDIHKPGPLSLVSEMEFVIVNIIGQLFVCLFLESSSSSLAEVVKKKRFLKFDLIIIIQALMHAFSPFKFASKLGLFPS